MSEQEIKAEKEFARNVFLEGFEEQLKNERDPGRIAWIKELIGKIKKA